MDRMRLVLSEARQVRNHPEGFGRRGLRNARNPGVEKHCGVSSDGGSVLARQPGYERRLRERENGLYLGIHLRGRVRPRGLLDRRQRLEGSRSLWGLV